jgi:hypothetical protein
MLKAITTILLIGLLAGMTIRAVLPRPPSTRPRRGPAVETARKCPDCGAYRLGDGRCPTPGCASSKG